MLRREDTGLILVDVQEAFRPVIDGFDRAVANCGLLAEGFGVLGRPVLVSEQYPKGLGQIVPELAERLPEGAVTIEKLRFSACGVDAFDEAIAAAGCSAWVIAGIETHVCVNQTVHDLLARGPGRPRRRRRGLVANGREPGPRPREDGRRRRPRHQRRDGPLRDARGGRLAGVQADLEVVR